ncbi:MAG: hypothetical protein LH475_01005 [Cryobacterium sp.]|uniref:hypothetical protein n=1 Tax=unclassified Cryobacterium TaxID=2649013 RepID=UPI0018CA8326|nr:MULTISPECIES: hypothetical protein [unclassified Cryobacterium]MCY7403208.1 hypothetical protein [Cryobacterium sp.]MEC5154545.1 hypothetical protein [Cryobacterium sp. CAN_C3]
MRLSIVTLLRQGETANVSFSIASGVELTAIVADQRAVAAVAVAGNAIHSVEGAAAAAADLRAAIS